GLEEHRDVALAVETAAVAYVAVVDEHRVDVRSLRPAHALDRDGDVAARLHDLRFYERDTGRDDVGHRGLSVTGHGAQGVPATQVVRGLEREREGAVRVGVHAGQAALDLFPAGAADAVACHRAPHELHGRVGWEAGARCHHGAAHDAGAVVEAEGRAIALGGYGCVATQHLRLGCGGCHGGAFRH